MAVTATTLYMYIYMWVCVCVYLDTDVNALVIIFIMVGNMGDCTQLFILLVCFPILQRLEATTGILLNSLTFKVLE